MFEIPNAKRVRREDLQSQSSRSSTRSDSSSEDDEARATALTKFQQAHGLSFDTHASPSQDDRAAPQPQSQDDQPQTDPNTFAFKLFAPSKPQTKPSQPGSQPITTDASIAQISLTGPDTSTGGFLPTRPAASPYFTPTRTYLSSLHASILTPTDLSHLQSQPHPGAARPWRVTHLTLLPSQQRRNADHLRKPLQPVNPADRDRRKCRKGKKTRIKIRMRLRKAEDDRVKKEEERKRAGEREKEKEEHLREKRTEKNRKKRLKKREDARVAKAAKNGDGQGGVSAEDDND